MQKSVIGLKASNGVPELTVDFHQQDLNPVEKAKFIKARIVYLAGQGDPAPKATVASELGVSTLWVRNNMAVLQRMQELDKDIMKYRTLLKSFACETFSI